VQSRLDDPEQKIMFADRKWVHVSGSGASAEHENGNVYLAISLRNAGSGIAILQRWYARPTVALSDVPPASPEEMRALTRDLYVPGGDVGLWQGALRDQADPAHDPLRRAVEAREPFTVELLYSDSAGGQRTLSRFGVSPGEHGWIAAVSRHWYLDGQSPR
jgi:hypothetical protein